jgi:type IV secretory pathway VirB3-like protein
VIYVVIYDVIYVVIYDVIYVVNYDDCLFWCWILLVSEKNPSIRMANRSFGGNAEAGMKWTRWTTPDPPAAMPASSVSRCRQQWIHSDP